MTERTAAPFGEGTTAARGYHPFGGVFKGLERFLAQTSLADLRITARPDALNFYAAALGTVAVGFSGWLVADGYSVVDPAVVAGLALTAAVAERSSVRLSSSIEISVSAFPALLAAVVLGPLPAMIVSGASMIVFFRPPYLRWAIYTSGRSLNGALTALTAAAATGLSANAYGSIVIATALAAATSLTIDTIVVAMTLRFRGTGTVRDVLRTFVPVLAGSVPLYTPVVALLAYSYQHISPWTLALFLAPAFAAQRLFVLYQEQRRLADDLAAANLHLERASLSFASALVAALDARDRYTAGHSAAVAVYSRDIASRLGLSEGDQQLAHLCGLLHDIGKVGLPPSILEKTGPLTLAERRQMEEHSVIGEQILRNVADYEEIAIVVRHHHERVDGNGYPDGMQGVQIPPVARIIAVADAYNAMTSGRPYREAMPSPVARLRLAQAVESQFDTTVVAAFEAILAGASESYMSGARADFALEAQKHPALARASATTAA